MMKREVFAATTALGLILAAPARAQQAPAAPSAPAATPADDSQIGEVIVTAQRRRESVQDVPVAVSAFSADDLQTRGVTNTLDLGQYVPNLIAQNNTGVGSANAYYLRGLGNTESIATFDPPVGTYVDDIYIARQNANNLNLFDVERVEVLRGPQGTLFGKNTTGGAISVILRQPGKTLGGYAEIGYGSYNKKLARASIDVPIAPTLQVKLSGYWQNDDGYVRDTVTGQRFNDDDGWGVRLGVHGDLSDKVKWNAGYAHIVADGTYVLNFTCNPANPSDCSGRFSATGFSKTPGAANFAALGVTGDKANYGLGNSTASDLVTSNLEFGVSDALSVNLITGFVMQRQHYGLDFYDGRGAPSLANPFPAMTGNARGGFTILDTGYTEQFSQEVKLSGRLFDGLLDYVSGFYYLHEFNRTDFADVFANALLLDDKVLRNTTTDYAGYVQADLNVTRQIKLTAGVRYTDETKALNFHDNRAVCNTGTTLPTTCFDNRNLFAANGTAIPTSQTARIWTPRFAINFKPSDDLLLYASATRGFKGGGWNARSTSVALVLPFDPEKVWSYEAGVKSEFLNRHVRFNLTGYIENVTNLQTLSAFVSSAGALTFLTRNFADYVNRGIEAELTVIPARGVNLYANVGFQKDHYRVPTNVPAFDQYGVQSVAAQLAACQAQLAQGRVGGTTAAPACAAGIVTAQGTIASPVRTPDLTISGGGSYTLPLGSGLTLVPSLNASFHTKEEVATSNLTLYTGAITGTAASGVGTTTYLANPNGGSEIAGSLSKAALLVNASITLNGPDKRWSLTGECSNCTNKTFFQSALGNYDYLNPPRMFTVRARYNF